MKEISYKFITIPKCDMCGSNATQFKLLGRRMNRSQGMNPGKHTAIITAIQKCKNCGLIFSNPMPVPLNIHDHYGVEPLEFWDKNYFKPNPEGMNYLVEQGLKYAGKNGKILDIGIGVGFGMKAMLDAGLDVTGIEPSASFYDYAITKSNIPKSKLLLCKLEESSFPPDTFDYVYFGAVLEHLYFPSAALNLVLKWVKPGGKIEMEVPNAGWLINKIFNTYYRLTLQSYVANISPMHPPYHLYEFTLKSFQFNGVINNYRIIHNHYFVAPTYLPSFFDKPLQFYMKKTNSGMQLIVIIEKT